MKAEVIDIWVGGETQVSTLKDAVAEFGNIASTGQFKMAFAFKTKDGKMHEATVREYPNKTVYIESDIQDGQY